MCALESCQPGQNRSGLEVPGGPRSSFVSPAGTEEVKGKRRCFCLITAWVHPRPRETRGRFSVWGWGGRQMSRAGAGKGGSQSIKEKTDQSSWRLEKST